MGSVITLANGQLELRGADLGVVLAKLISNFRFAKLIINSVSSIVCISIGFLSRKLIR